MDQPSDPDKPGYDPHGVTSFHVRRAVAGDADSLEWVVRRLTPLLLSHATYRLRAAPADVDAEDLVQEAWLTTLPRLEDLRPRDGRITPVLLRFMTTTVNRRVRDLLQKHLRGATVKLAAAEAETVHAGVSTVVTRAIGEEARDAVWNALKQLGRADREIMVLRGIEQSPLEAVAVVVDSTPEAVRKRYQRILLRLRSLVPQSVFGELADPV